MRHTLLPLHERKALRLEYRVRIFIVACFTLSLAGLVGIAAIFPVFMQASTEERRQENLLTGVKKSGVDASLASLQQGVAKSQALLEFLSSSKDRVKLSDSVAGLIALKRDLKFNSLSISRVATSSLAISVQGLAPFRDSLLSFKSAFESANPGNSVELPISDLAKNSNIRFSLNLVQKIHETTP